MNKSVKCTDKRYPKAVLALAAATRKEFSDYTRFEQSTIGCIKVCDVRQVDPAWFQGECVRYHKGSLEYLPTPVCVQVAF